MDFVRIPASRGRRRLFRALRGASFLALVLASADLRGRDGEGLDPDVFPSRLPQPTLALNDLYLASQDDAPPGNDALVGADTTPGTEVEEPASGERLRFIFEGRYWRPVLTGSMEVTKGGKPGSGGRINVQEDLDLDPGNVPQAAFDLAYGNHRIGCQYVPIRFKGEDTLTRDIIFHGETFPDGLRIHSDLDLTFWTFFYDYRIFHRSWGEIRAGLQGYHWGFDVDIEGVSPGSTLKEHRGFTSFLPAVRIEGEGRLGAFHLRSELIAGALSSQRNVLDLNASVGVTLWRMVGLDLGYRWVHFSLSETTNTGNLAMHGPYAALVLGF